MDDSEGVLGGEAGSEVLMEALLLIPILPFDFSNNILVFGRSKGCFIINNREYTKSWPSRFLNQLDNQPIIRRRNLLHSIP